MTGKSTYKRIIAGGVGAINSMLPSSPGLSPSLVYVFRRTLKSKMDSGLCPVTITLYKNYSKRAGEICRRSLIRPDPIA